MKTTGGRARAKDFRSDWPPFCGHWSRCEYCGVASFHPKGDGAWHGVVFSNSLCTPALCKIFVVNDQNDQSNQHIDYSTGSGVANDTRFDFWSELPVPERLFNFFAISRKPWSVRIEWACFWWKTSPKCEDIVIWSQRLFCKNSEIWRNLFLLQNKVFSSKIQLFRS